MSVMPDFDMDAFSRAVWRGRSMFRRGEAMPPTPGDDEDRSLKAALWYGYMLARGDKLMKQWRVKSVLEGDHDPDDRPPASMAA